MRRLSRWLLLLVTLLMATTGRTQKTPRTNAAPTRANLSSESERWVAQTLKRMTLEEKLGQLVMVFYYGGFLAAESPGYKDLLRQVEQNHLGGFVVQKYLANHEAAAAVLMASTPPRGGQLGSIVRMIRRHPWR